MGLQVLVIAHLFTAGRINDQKFCKFGRHQERRRHTETLPSVSACLVRGSERIPIAYVGSDAVLLGLRQDCLSILGQSLSSRPSRLHWMRHPVPMLISFNPGQKDCHTTGITRSFVEHLAISISGTT